MRVDSERHHRQADPVLQPSAGPESGGQEGLQDPASQPAPRRRARQVPGRRSAVKVLYDEAEYALVRAAAALVGLTPTGFVAGAGVAAASPAAGHGGPLGAVDRGVLAELMAARTQVRRVGTNLNQALVVLHSTGVAPGWLPRAVQRCEDAVQHLDEVTLAVAQRLDRARPRRTTDRPPAAG